MTAKVCIVNEEVLERLIRDADTGLRPEKPHVVSARSALAQAQRPEVRYRRKGQPQLLEWFADEDVPPNSERVLVLKMEEPS